MKITEFNFKHDFLNILIDHLNEKGLRSVYNINVDAKYNIDYIVNVITAISNPSYSRFKIPQKLAEYFKESIYTKYSKTSLKSLVKKQLFTSNTDSFFNTYVIIGNDIPITIKELTVVV